MDTMQYTHLYRSPLGTITLAADSEGLTGLWFEGQKYFAATLDAQHEETMLPIFEQTRRWLDNYFGGNDPGPTPPLHLQGSPFRLAVWEILRQIPFGKTITYGEIAREIADITISGECLMELVNLRRLSHAMMKRIQQNYHSILGVNGGLILLGVAGIIQPTTSAFFHNLTTLILGLRSMRHLLPEE